MAIAVAIFEDDFEVGEIVVEMLQDHHIQAQMLDRISKDSLQNFDIILGDYRNKLILFSDLIKISKEIDIPLIAISGAHCDYSPHLIKPFNVEDLLSLIQLTLGTSQDHSRGLNQLKKAS